MASPEAAEQNQTMPEIPDAAVRRVVDLTLKFYVPNNPKNGTHKSIKDWTAADFKNIDRDDLRELANIMSTEHYSVSDDLLPKGMSRQDFVRSLDREMARRDTLKTDYLDRLFVNVPKPVPQVRVLRAAHTIGGKPGNSITPEMVQEAAGIIALRDMAINITTDSQDTYIPLQPDFTKAVGLNPNTVVPLRSDVRAYEVGYLVGSRREFTQSNGLYLGVHFDEPLQTVQSGYCATVAQIFQPGKAYDNSVSVVNGFMQARVDARTNFEPTTEHVGLGIECPVTPITPRASSAGKDSVQTVVRK